MLLAAPLHAAEPGQAAAPGQAAERPRIGLVLGGGGARGGAHVGILKVLDELRVPVDCVAGTSMGALVGATFASGMPADELERRLGAIDWAATIGTSVWRNLEPMQRKLSGVTYSNSIEFSAWGGELHGDAGFIPAQQVEAELRLLISGARNITDFDHLPLPFRAVATDLRSSSMVVLGAGDLGEAMRASMAVPGLFSPVVRGDQVLTDGGMVRNLPVDVARELCADVVIAVALAIPPPGADELSSLFTAAGRSIDVVIEANEKAQLATLESDDIAIVVPVGDIRAGDFARVMETIPLGEAAARAVAADLQRYAVPEDDYQRWRAAVTRRASPPVHIATIEFRPLRHASAEYLATRLETRIGDEVTRAELEADMSRVFASGDFERVDYRLVPYHDDGYRLVIDAQEKRGETDFIRFDLGLAGSAGGDVLFALRADHRREWVNARGGQWSNALQLGQISALGTAFYQPLDVAQKYYVEPSLGVRRSLEDFFLDGDRIASYRLLETGAGVDVGVNVGNHLRLFSGVRMGIADFNLDTGAVSLLDEERSRDNSLVVGGLYDTRDSAYLPTRGSYGQFEYRNSNRWLGGEESYTQLEAVVGRALPWRKQVLLLVAGAGHTLSGDLPRYRDFRIGGARSFPAVQRGELRSEGYWSGSATWMLRLADIQALFGQVFYGGFGLQALRLLDPTDGGPDETILGASFTLGARTPVGPLMLTLGVADNDSVELHLALGRPIAEGSLLDRLQ
ncbi:patatin-like phospholipase family protein [Thioalkalivibrio sp. XN279]|uniref:patatin-like phospholipase family protein n=1 Tax=Thioalkalivibrio sp. XN279 TaxID=2714953 RepID=UPI00140999E7|nr:patatin-like phospholipase family protein [Thioalkalivibrio sp. XN279]NHA15977.1 BamA/TamA family outer membrane protein [Thioalkalivibrio sp. XN279]